MKTFRPLVAVLGLSLLLSTSAFAGEMQTPGITNPPPPPSAANSIVAEPGVLQGPGFSSEASSSELTMVESSGIGLIYEFVAAIF
jgi:hypothetical protein